MAESVRAEGGCRCGHTRFAVTGVPLLTAACHCKGCQRMTASAFSLSSLYPAAAFELLSGEPVPGGMKGETRHFFCPECLSWLYTVPPMAEGLVNVRSGMLDDFAGHEPFAEFYLAEALPGMALDLPHAFHAATDMDGFERLVADLAAQRGQ